MKCDIDFLDEICAFRKETRTAFLKKKVEELSAKIFERKLIRNRDGITSDKRFDFIVEMARNFATDHNIMFADYLVEDVSFDDMEYIVNSITAELANRYGEKNSFTVVSFYNQRSLSSNSDPRTLKAGHYLKIRKDVK